MRAVCLGEDACRARSGALPYLLARLRNLTIHRIRQVAGKANVTAARRRQVAHPEEALMLLQQYG